MEATVYLKRGFWTGVSHRPRALTQLIFILLAVFVQSLVIVDAKTFPETLMALRNKKAKT